MSWRMSVLVYNWKMDWLRHIFLAGLMVVWMPTAAAAQGLSITPWAVGENGSAASEEARLGTPAAQLLAERVTEKKPDITETQGETVGKLGQYVLSRPVQPLSLTNFLQHAVRNAILSGVPGSTIVLVILFPLVAAIIAGARHLIGLRGFGIFTPAILSVAFVATGIFTGITLFLVILAVATIAKNLLRRAKLQYLPRMALLIWFVCVGVLIVMLAAPAVGLQNLVTLGIFPILILVLLAETFIEVQIGKSQREASELTTETIVLALISSLVLSLEAVQRFALIHPELLLGGVVVINVFLGRYKGLRLTEYLKFKKLLD
jgi:hypothetical protein